MKLRGPLFFSAFALIFLAAAYWPPVNSAEKEAILMHTIIRGLEELHYNPQDINDDFSEKAFDLYIDRIDGGRRWLTQKDVDQLKKFRTNIDDQMGTGTYQFFDLAIKMQQEGIKKTRAYYEEILEKAFDFSGAEEIELDGDKKAFAKNEKQLREYWRKMLKYDVMTNLAGKIEAQEKTLAKKAKGEEIDKDFEEMTMEQMEEKARKDVLKRFDNWYNRLDKERRTDHLSYYINAITNVFDPHTSYYEPKDKANFDINMSGTLEGIGARLQTNEEYTKVVSIVPGGPAWKGKDLEVEDKIVKVAQGDEDPVDVTGWRIDDVVSKIRGKKGTEVRLTVKKVDGSEEVISITRDVVILDEGYAKSAILNYPDVAENVGYIKLPRFYADFNRNGGRSCFTDVANEIDKLKAQNVDGIIIDLRNNGGGSLRDVVKMSGLFIEEGPIVQVKARNNAPEILEDEDPRVQYDGKLIIMVNQFSASASEILAAALQDYGRAVIVGSQSTFGKGTVQRFFDLDRAIRGNSEIKPLGEVKMTIQKFYRVNGGSTQLKGVTPDIILPNNYAYIKTGEQDQEYAMEWTEIPPVDYKQNVRQIPNLKILKQLSEKRVSNNEVFNMVDENAQRLKAQRDKTTYPLNLKAFQKLDKELEAHADKYEDIFQEIEGLDINNLAVDIPAIEMDEGKKARNDEWLKDLRKDAYLEETLHILHDMSNIK